MYKVGFKERLYSLRGSTGLATILLLIISISTVASAIYFYLEKQKTDLYYNKKQEALNQKVITLSEELRESEIKNTKLQASLEQFRKEADDYRKKFQEVSETNLILTELKTNVSEEFVRVNKALQTGFSKVENFSRFFESKIESYFNDAASPPPSDLTRKTNFPVPPPASSKGQVELPKVVVNPDEVKTYDRSEPMSVPETRPMLQPEMIDPPQPQKPLLPIPKNEEPSKRVKVMNVYQEHNFFVIDKGMIDGVKPGDNVFVYRNDVRIGKGRISEVRELLSIAEIEEQYGENIIEENDWAQFA